MLTLWSLLAEMFALLFDLEDYATTYRATRDAYLKAANELKLATGPYKAARDAYVAATATYTKSLYE
jgi:ABC-type transporter lipoprotein component MlaA